MSLGGGNFINLGKFWKKSFFEVLLFCEINRLKSRAWNMDF
jgi:hypothetical protein